MTDEEIIRAAAIKYAHDDDVDIDHNPTLAHDEGGCWVRAWLWVSYPDSEGD